MGKIIGIDLGTTNSMVSVKDAEQHKEEDEKRSGRNSSELQRLRRKTESKIPG